ncbi:MAG: metal-dependent phosphohydrolase [Wendovervirus sonii]|uniref:Metal-dependent phosphohydrolase n=1 Tax=phage Lak_Megaphage_Sonny TaxID=3109229 RepID=A0ABZ0Z3G3_9CAUD|nr:MAG: metal-dependent phosphohydrolase [phage Lak_Megaphage_Sonny]
MAKLTSTQIFNNKQEFISLLQKVQRPGIDSLITWLEEKSDFFTAPSSSKYHGASDGGLCQHSLNVYHALKKLIDVSKEIALPEKQINGISEETIILVSLMHDFCKTNFYQPVYKFYKDDSTGNWVKYIGYDCVDKFPVGHGEKSVIMLQNFIKLSQTEIIAIRWHMGLFDVSTTVSPYQKPAYMQINNECPLAILLQEADFYASFMMEPFTDPKIDNVVE